MTAKKYDESEPSWVTDIWNLLKAAVPRLNGNDAPPDEHEDHLQYNLYLSDMTGRFTKKEASMILLALHGSTLTEFNVGVGEGEAIAIFHVPHPCAGDDVCLVWVMNDQDDQGFSNPDPGLRLVN